MSGHSFIAARRRHADVDKVQITSAA